MAALGGHWLALFARNQLNKLGSQTGESRATDYVGYAGRINHSSCCVCHCIMVSTTTSFPVSSTAVTVEIMMTVVFLLAVVVVVMMMMMILLMMMWL